MIKTKELSDLRQNFNIYYLDRLSYHGMPMLGELATVRTKKGQAFSINDKGKVIRLIGEKVYPPEIPISIKVTRAKNDSLEDVYQKAQDKRIEKENKIYQKLISYEGKGRLFIRAEFIQSTDKHNEWCFQEVIHVVKGNIR